MKRVGLVSGPTGGHLLPSLVVARELNSYDVRPELISTLPPDHHFLENVEFGYHRLHVKPWSGSGIVGRFSSLSSMVREYVVGRMDLDNYSALISFGGYPSVPVLMGARIKGIPYFIQEQNRVPGRANSLFTAHSQKIFLGLPTRNEILSTRTEITGNPIRKFSPELDDDWWDYDRILLVMGGSQGSLEVSEFLENTLDDLKEQGWKIFYVKGAYGKDLSEQAVDYGDKFRQVQFRYDLPSLMARSTVVWSRAGAGTISELIHYDKPAVLFPYSKASDDHQKWNARWLENQGPAISAGTETSSNTRDRVLSFTFQSRSQKTEYDHPWDPEIPAEKQISNAVLRTI